MEKIKITQKEIDELYDITDDTPNEQAKNIDISNVESNAQFEEFTEYYDENQHKQRVVKENG